MIGKTHFVAAYALLAAAVLFLNLYRELGVPMKQSFQHFPGTVGRWQMTGESTLPESVQAVLRASEVLMRRYENGKGVPVELYVGYHDGGKSSGEIHSPKHCLPGSGWHEVASAQRTLPVADGELNLVQAVYQKGDNRQLFLYWYQVRDDSISDEYGLKLAGVFNSILHRRRDASFIRISVPVQGKLEEALALGENFIKDVLPELRGFLPT